jgi:hypothetical protein
MGEKRNAFGILVAKARRKVPRGRPGRMWKDNIKMDLREIKWDYMDWIHLDQGKGQWKALVNTVMNLRVP